MYLIHTITSLICTATKKEEEKKSTANHDVNRCQCLIFATPAALLLVMKLVCGYNTHSSHDYQRHRALNLKDILLNLGRGLRHG